VNDDGTQFLMNRDRVHFSRVKASNLLLLDANDPEVMTGPDAPDPTAWFLHGAIHRKLPHARCAMHVHSHYATALACLADPILPPLDQNAAMFFNRQAVDLHYGGLAFEEEGERCAALMADAKTQVLVMGNHGIMVIGPNVAETFHRMYIFERAARNYLTALATGRPLRMIPEPVAEKTAQEIESYPGGHQHHLAELKAILDAEGSDYAD